jgi:hypothetical protein
LRPVLARALAKDPAKRYADGGEMAEALRAALEGRAPAAVSRRAAWPRAALVLGLAVAGVAAAFLVRTTPPHASSPPVTAAPSASVLEPSPPLPSPEPATPLATPRPRSRPPSVAERPAAPAPTPAPTPPPQSSPAAAPQPAAPTHPAVATPAPIPTPEADGALLVVARPWADVSVDGVPRGETPLGRIPLAPGPHAVLLTHPDYQPYPRRVTIHAGETARLTVDLATDGVRRR